ncbi:MAG TPA: prolipoprotein diacylglyceryl transferase [Anaeromyxobacteraceae bacterium]|jgi:phosphatidylglycerol:prolipoprotein diacylglycerol transferase|nr:prolipoprotein diacylglyceryl transferase [Anaeromyxobacteraceae bacterium]
MLPILFELALPGPAALALALAAVAALAVARAVSFRRELARGGRSLSFGAALWDDKLTVGALLVAVAVGWRAGVFAGTVRLPLHSYGLAMATAFLVGIQVAQRLAKRDGLDPERVGDLAFWIVIAALVGSRLYFIAVNWDDYFGAGASVETALGRIPRLVAIWEGGLVFYGGFLGAVAVSVWYMRRHRMPFLRYADALIPSVALGHFFGRLGCFGAGCCWGGVSHSHLPWLTRFPPASLAYQTFAARPNAAELLAPDQLTTLPVHPTQLYESFGELGLFLALVFLVRPRRSFHGQVLATWLLCYAVLRSLVEVFRGDLERGVVAGFGVGQWTSVVIFAAGAALLAWGRRQSVGARAEPAI